ncbi:hypothetical protein NP233_g4921 [Leucocoprinus birnbaumii]|uniref:PPM-type phosphatase domain-containing protein n=1 Tax=Leucocoprinus birnbaumii TaxID=56174 RepID=A0AAD5VW49_9AGAR|nr:hypothetical protein NP233_g4921 [Leucocoprinus birnbaumii]
MTGLTITIPDPETMALPIITEYIKLHPRLSDLGWGGYSGFSNTSLQAYWVAPNVSLAQVNETMSPFFDFVKNTTLNPNATTLTIPFDDFPSWLNFTFGTVGGGSQVGVNVELASRLLARDAAEGERAEQTAKRLLGMNGIAINAICGGAVSRINPSSAGLNPNWRKAVGEVYTTGAWADGTPASVIEGIRKQLIQDIHTLDPISPGSATYMNELRYRTQYPSWYDGLDLLSRKALFDILSSALPLANGRPSAAAALPAAPASTLCHRTITTVAVLPPVLVEADANANLALANVNRRQLNAELPTQAECRRNSTANNGMKSVVSVLSAHSNLTIRISLTMAWPAAGRRLCFGLTTVAAVSYFSSYRKPIIYADSEDDASQSVDNQAPRKWDPLANHIWMASDRGGWHGVKVIQYDYATLPNRGDRQTSLGFHAVKMGHGCNWVLSSLTEGLRGWETCVFVFKALIPSAYDLLDILIRRYTTPLGDPDKIYPCTELKHDVPSEEFDNAIRRAFHDVDRAIVDQARDLVFSSPSKSLNAFPLASAISGCTAMLAFYDDGTRTLKIANVGDGRAVLGRQAVREDGTQYLKVEVLSSEHTSTNPSEKARIDEAYSAEDISIVQRHVGRDVTRAFGLAMCKWSQEVQERMHKEYMGDPPLRGLSSGPTSNSETRSPPYITAEPEITTVQVGPDDVLIMANKGLWNSLTNEEAVGLLGKWLMQRNYRLQEPITEPTEENFMTRDMLPVDFSNESEDTTTWYKRWNLPKKFICVDSNAGVHLIRNALGGAHRDFTEGLLMVPYPFCANNREELAVTVIFFE